MSPCLLGCVVFCLLQAGESWGAGSPSGFSTKHVRCDCRIGPPSTGAVHAGVTQDPRFQVVRTGQSTILTYTQDLDHNSMYWYEQDAGHRLRLIHYSAAYPSTEKRECPRATASPDQAQRTSLSRWSPPTPPRHLCTSAPAVTPRRYMATCSLCKKTHT